MHVVVKHDRGEIFRVVCVAPKNEKICPKKKKKTFNCTKCGILVKKSNSFLPVTLSVPSEQFLFGSRVRAGW